MKRVYVICEGQTEETFVRELLYFHFLSKGVDLRPTLIGKPGHKGGNVSFDRLLIDIKMLLADKEAYCTCFLDYYGLPSKFPGKIIDKNSNFKQKFDLILNKLQEEVGKKLNNSEKRFFPYIQMYEFEALLFSDPTNFALGIDRDDLANDFKKICDNFDNPEMINDSPETAPAKRIINLVGNYDKPVMGTLAAIEIGLETIRNKCPLFNDWLNKIESLGS